MDYSEYTTGDTKIEEYKIRMPDGVSLNIIDFIPDGDSKDRPIVLFVAGWISLISGWIGVMQKITPEYRTIYIETREKSSSILPENKKVRFTIDVLTNDLREVIKELIPENRKYIISGSSLGATVILEYLALNFSEPECAILIAPVPEFRFPLILGDIINITPPSLYFVIKPVVKWYLKNFRLDKEKEKEQIKKYENTLDAADPYKLKANALAIKKYIIWDRLPDVKIPTLIIGATSDTLHGTDTLKRMLDLIPKSDYRELESNKETHSKKAGELIVNYIKKKEYQKI